MKTEIKGKFATLFDVEQCCLRFGLTQEQADEIVELTRSCMMARGIRAAEQITEVFLSKYTDR